jgi:hypothetical protein
MTHAYPPGGAALVDRLLVGAIDLHHHGYPEINFELRTRTEDVEELRNSQRAGMAGVVIKSHMWPTVGRAYLLRSMVPEIDVIPSLTLNTVVGGFNPTSVESAAEQGARVLFMPTWSAANDLERGGISKFFAGHLKGIAALKPDKGLRVTGPDGKVLPGVKECLSVAGQYGMCVFTGHISPRESIALAECAKDYGINEIVFSHPDSNSVGATRDEIRAMAALGAIHEFCALGFLYQRISPKTALEILAEVTPDRAIMTTDYFYDWVPPGAEMLRMLIGMFLRHGVSAGDIEKMVKTVPERLLGRTATTAAVRMKAV